MEKKWCVYGWIWGYWGVGKVMDEGTTLNILYSEEQCYPAEPWNSKWVKRFDTLREALAEFFRYNSYKKNQYLEWIYHAFTEQAKEEKLSLEMFRRN